MPEAVLRSRPLAPKRTPQSFLELANFAIRSLHPNKESVGAYLARNWTITVTSAAMLPLERL